MCSGISNHRSIIIQNMNKCCMHLSTGEQSLLNKIGTHAWKTLNDYILINEALGISNGWRSHSMMSVIYQ